MAEPEEDWIRSLLAAGANGISVHARSREDAIAAGRTRLARRRALTGAVLATVAAGAIVLAGCRIATSDTGTGHGSSPVSASAETYGASSDVGAGSDAGGSAETTGTTSGTQHGPATAVDRLPAATAS